MYEERLPDFIDPREQVELPRVPESYCVELGPKDASRSRQSWLREYNISIRFLSIGCIIDVGCKSIPFLSVDEAMKELNAYISNPESESKKWLKILD
jgi:hypothetical protein